MGPSTSGCGRRAPSLRADLLGILDAVRSNREWSRLDLAVEFAPTGSLQELAIANDWHDEYVHLSSVVDAYTGK
jgi:hypothetical protein